MSVSIPKPSDAAASASRNSLPESKTGKAYLDYTRNEVLYTLGFLLSMSMTGLNFPLGYLFLLIYLINSFRNSKYDFLIMVTLILGGYNLTSYVDFHFDLAYLQFLIGFVSMLVLRKTPIIKKMMWAMGAYFVALFWLAMQSDESIFVQYLGLRNYLSIIYVFFPIAVFSAMEFDIFVFFRKMLLYCLIICAFYFIDSVILGGAMLLPRDSSLMTYDIVPRFYDLWIDPVSSSFLRRWPLGLYPLSLCIFALVRYYRLTVFQWALIVSAILICRTFTVTIAFAVAAVISMSNKKQIFRMALTGVAALTILYYVDGAMGEWYVSDDQDDRKIKMTTLRLKSQIDQVFMLDLANGDEEALATLGTGRGAQIIPKLELVYKYDKQWTGLGFLARDLTKNKKYIIENEMYGNPLIADEVAIGVESAPFDIFITIGFIGLIVHTLFWFWMWFIVRKLAFSRYFISIIVVFAMIGIGAVSLYSPFVLLLVSLCYAAVILQQKKDLEGFAMPKEARHRHLNP